MANKPWNYYSAVATCETCDGIGKVHANRMPTTGDPFPEMDCPDCDGPGAGECPVCGFDHYIPGYDCLACDTVLALDAFHLGRFNVDDFAKAVAVAHGLALKERDAA